MSAADARTWLEGSAGPIAGDFLPALQDGEVLCTLANAIMRNAIKAPFDAAKFLKFCKRLGVPAGEIPASLADEGEVVACIHAVQRTALEELGFTGAAPPAAKPAVPAASSKPAVPAASSKPAVSAASSKPAVPAASKPTVLSAAAGASGGGGGLTAAAQITQRMQATQLESKLGGAGGVESVPLTDSSNPEALIECGKSGGDHVPLLKAGFDVRKQDKHGYTALMYSCLMGRTTIAKACIAADPSSDHIRMQDDKGRTALNFASDKRRVAIVEALIAADPSPEHIRMQDQSGVTPLNNACLSGYTNIVKVLLAADGSAEHVGIADEDGNTPLSVVMDDEIERLLRNAGATSKPKTVKKGPQSWQSKLGGQ